MIGTMNNTMKTKKEKVKMAETLVAVHTHTHTHTGYCLLVNKIIKKVNIKNRGRTMPVMQVIGLPFCAFTEKVYHNYMRGVP